MTPNHQIAFVPARIVLNKCGPSIYYAIRYIFLIVLMISYIIIVITSPSETVSIPTHFYTLEWPKCPLCDFTPLKYWSNSTPDDYFMMYVYGLPLELHTCIRTLRTVGSRCQIVVIVDAFDISKLFQSNIFADCGVTVSYYQKATNRFPCSQGIMHYRWSAFRDFLRSISHANRVCISDSDVIMQEDPFSVYIEQRTDNDIYLMAQAHTFDMSEPDVNWTTAWYIPERGDIPLAEFRHKPTLNCGSLFGSHHAILLVCAEMADRFESRPDLACLGNDQGSFTNIMYSKWPARNNITLHYFHSATDPYVFIAFVSVRMTFPNVIGDGPHKHFYIHHLHSAWMNAATIRTVCPRINKFDFLRSEVE